MIKNSKLFIVLAVLYLACLLPIEWMIVSIILFIVGFILWLITIIKLRRLKLSSWKIYLIFNPLIIFCVIGILQAFYGYSTGTATFFFDKKDHRLHLDSYQDFHFEYRVFYMDFRGKHYGSLTYLSAWRFYEGHVNDFSLKLLTKTFGYQHGMFKDAFPSGLEIYSAIQYLPHEKILLDSAGTGFVKFSFRNKKHLLTGISKNSELLDACFFVHGIFFAHENEPNGTFTGTLEPFYKNPDPPNKKKWKRQPEI